MPRRPAGATERAHARLALHRALGALPIGGAQRGARTAVVAGAGDASQHLIVMRRTSCLRRCQRRGIVATVGVLSVGACFF
ncbi:MAG: hypothetical protein RLZZ494_988 [Pseudomonadota bacterium]